MTTAQITDEQLVAFLDGQAAPDLAAQVARAIAEDPALAARVEALKIPHDALREGFDALLAEAPAIPVARPARMAWGGWRAAAAAAVLFVAGLGLGWGLAPERDSGWHQAVADYQVLYSGATLKNLPMQPDQRVASLVRTSADLGLSLDPAQVAVPGLEFQRAQILQYYGQPLAQLTYLDAGGNPIAFCMMPAEQAQAAVTHQISGLNAVTWAKNGMGFILIGPVTPQSLQQAHQVLAARI